MLRQCKNCHFLVRYQLQVWDGYSGHDDIKVTRVLWSDEDTSQLLNSVNELAEPTFPLVVDGSIGKRFGGECARNVFQVVQGDPMQRTTDGHPTQLIGDEAEILRKLKTIIERKRGRRECFFMPRDEGMEIDTAMDLEARRYTRRTNFWTNFRSYVALAVAIASAGFAYMRLDD